MELLLFTQATCARCPQAKQALAEFLAQTPDARAREVDARAEPKLVRRHEVMSTPWAVLVNDEGAMRAEGLCMTPSDFAALWRKGAA